MATTRRTRRSKSAVTAMSEVGYSGTRMFDGVSQEELIRELNPPRNFKVFKEMSYHPAINTPLSLYNHMVSKATFRVNPVKDASAEETKQAEIVESMFKDMDVSMEDVITDVMSMSIYGFSVFEKVFRYRKKEYGSMYDDGVIGIKKIAYRSQETIEKFEFSDDGNEVIGLEQDISLVSDPYNRFKARQDTKVYLPRKKFMLFTAGRNRTNPYGVSPLRDVYLPWKYLTSIEELEATGVAKDLQGLPVLKIPAQYMNADASPEQKALYEQFKAIARNLQMNSQSGLIIPSTVDPDTRQPLFEVDLLSTEGGKKNYDTTQVKDYYRTMIFIGLNADILLMGNTQTGSFALGNIKTSLTGSFVESMLRNIVKEFNNDLIRQIYELNGWDVSRRCSLDYEGFEDVDLETFSKAIQRIGAVGYLPKTHGVINKILNTINVDEIDEDEDLDSILPESTTRAGDGMKEGMGSGTGSAEGKSGDSTTSNSEN